MRRSIARACLAIALAAFVGSNKPAAAQDSSEDRVHALIRDNDRKVDEFLAKHPVRQSPLFESATDLLATLAKFDFMILGACESAPDSPDWRQVAYGLHGNTIIALGRSYREGRKKYVQEAPLAQEMQGAARCTDYEADRIGLLRRLPSVFAALRKQGY
jgi:hypothetical protein